VERDGERLGLGADAIRYGGGIDDGSMTLRVASRITTSPPKRVFDGDE